MLHGNHIDSKHTACTLKYNDRQPLRPHSPFSLTLDTVAAINDYSEIVCGRCQSGAAYENTKKTYAPFGLWIETDFVNAGRTALGTRLARTWARARTNTDRQANTRERTLLLQPTTIYHMPHSKTTRDTAETTTDNSATNYESILKRKSADTRMRAALRARRTRARCGHRQALLLSASTQNIHTLLTTRSHGICCIFIYVFVCICCTYIDEFVCMEHMCRLRWDGTAAEAAALM